QERLYFRCVSGTGLLCQSRPHLFQRQRLWLWLLHWWLHLLCSISLFWFLSRLFLRGLVRLLLSALCDSVRHRLQTVCQGTEIGYHVQKKFHLTHAPALLPQPPGWTVLPPYCPER